MSTDDELGILLAERAVERLMETFAASLDGGDWDAYAATFAPDGTFEIMGDVRTGRAEISAGPARDLTRYARVQHLLCNRMIVVDVDRAAGHWSLIAIHIPDAAAPDDHADLGLRYAFQAQRGEDGWRFAHVAVEVQWTAGDEFRLASKEHSA